MKTFIKKVLPSGLYNTLKTNPIRRNQKIKQWYCEKGADIERAVEAGARVFLLNTPWHKNLGDLAIALAEMEFLTPLMAGKGPLVNVSALSQNIFAVDALRNLIPKDGLLLFHGGGYLGTDWPNEEYVFQKAVTLFPEHRIILLPQSIYYKQGAEGERALAVSQRVYNAHPDLHLFARDQQSYQMMMQHYAGTHVYLAPDMVLSMERNDPQRERNGILLCMRGDREKLLTQADLQHIEACCQTFAAITYTDTFAPDEYDGPIGPSTWEPLVNAKLEQFRKAQLVVTDRLHGMIFSAITGTPCIAFSNHNHKVQGAYKWIENLPYIRYLKAVDGLQGALEALLALDKSRYNRTALLTHYQTLTDRVTESLEMQP